MRLLQLKTLGFEESFEEDIPTYAAMPSYLIVEASMKLRTKICRVQPAFVRMPSGSSWQDTQVEWGKHIDECNPWRRAISSPPGVYELRPGVLACFLGRFLQRRRS
ncbi:hypothetical protein LTR56_006071 [Elasticomyces elasticus]|nr:hypothetical protein LTR56_006071 [Elasticomyces elasticus]KAK3667667.1 hypothetical protein LTR22_001482 [Elasticomyces elasticus]KAK4928378.1 hypothetical protein LTR49_004785 [Elasticomyces elasticus]KAK5767179.1 hypothetical protein LTS12_002637 [Elasticomyces elasticus]